MLGHLSKTALLVTYTIGGLLIAFSICSLIAISEGQEENVLALADYIEWTGGALVIALGTLAALERRSIRMECKRFLRNVRFELHRVRKA